MMIEYLSLLNIKYCYTIALLLLFVFHAQERKVWAVLFIMALLLDINSLVFPNVYGSPLFIARTFIVFLASLLLVCTGTLHAYYQGCICVVTLVLFALLEFDLATGSNIVYDGYEGLIYGTMAIRGLGIAVGYYSRKRPNPADSLSDNDHTFICKVQAKKSST